MKNKKLVLAISLVLVAMVAVGGTLAWLTDRTDPVVNVFTGSDVDITLDETTGNEYKMVPGNTITKDPKVTVLANSEPSWVFVKVEKTANFDNYMTYQIADEWTALTGVDGVYYMAVGATSTDVPFNVIKGNTVTVKNTVTKTMMDQLTAENYPKLTVTAYAIQQSKDNNAKFTPAEAWAELNPAP